MDKRQLLIETTKAFREALLAGGATESGLRDILSELNPLFVEIEAGRVTPPYQSKFNSPFQSDGYRYNRSHPLFSVAVEFEAALLDWRSWASFQAALAQSKAGLEPND